jgi:hypothetical protein
MTNKRRTVKLPVSALLYALLCFNWALFGGACSVPVLESQECIEARQTLKEFYSIHFDGDMHFSAENLKLKERFLTNELAASVRDSPPDIDVFTVKSDDLPKAFRIGNCRAVAPDRAVFEVLLFWKTDTRSEQRGIEVETVKRNEQWLINNIIN